MLATPGMFALATLSQSGKPVGLFDYLPMFAVMGLIFYFLLIRPQSKEKKKRAKMLSQIKKNDRVVTIGGIVGTVATVKEDEVTLKVDESNNTKITFTRVAIQRVMSAETATTAEKPAK
ncbi:MAG: preprotein translocase subunit YajC [Planctomycetota bacterium]|nr:preprotein translocase subunit YajC [Planctomycetota bacterium]